MAKVHLLRNKNVEVKVLAACASNPYIEGSKKNNRANYQFMASEVVNFEVFKNTPAADRCAHCMDAGLIIRNRQRKAKGLSPVSHLME